MIELAVELHYNRQGITVRATDGSGQVIRTTGPSPKQALSNLGALIQMRALLAEEA
jgi:hypothetical protein